MGEFIDAYEEHVWAVYGFLARRTRSRPDAEDLTQRTFERAHRSWERFDPARGKAESWLLAIARNVYVDWRREGGRAAVPMAPGELPEAGGGGVAEPGPEPELEAAIGRLSSREREAIALRFGGDLPIAEVAEVMGISLANAQQILSRALRKLRRELESRNDLLRISAE